MKTYICKLPVELSRKDFDRINDLFRVDFNDESPEMEALIDKLDARPDTKPCTFWWDFEDGSTVRMDILSNENCYWVDTGIIGDEDDGWVEPCYSIEEKTTIPSSDGESEYICKIKILEDK